MTTKINTNDINLNNQFVNGQLYDDYKTIYEFFSTELEGKYDGKTLLKHMTLFTYELYEGQLRNLVQSKIEMNEIVYRIDGIDKMDLLKRAERLDSMFMHLDKDNDFRNYVERMHGEFLAQKDSE